MQILQNATIDLRKKDIATAMLPKSLTPFTNKPKQLLLPPSTTSTKAKEKVVAKILENNLKLKPKLGGKSLQEDKKEQESGETGDIHFLSRSKCRSLHIDGNHQPTPVKFSSSNLLEVTSHSIIDEDDDSQASKLYSSSPLPPILSSRPSIIQSFVPGDLPNFWQCPQCRHIPLTQRPKHSVLYHCAPTSEEVESDVVPPTSLVHPIIKVHFDVCGNHRYRKFSKRKISKEKEMDNTNTEFRSGNHDATYANNGKSSDAKANSSRSDEDYVDKLSMKGSWTRTIGRSRTRGRQQQHSKKARLEASTASVEQKDNVDEISDEVTSTIDPPSSTVSLCPRYNVVHTPITNNGIVHPTKDAKLTATIDIVLLSQMIRCYYVKTQDTRSHLRERNNALPENFPGIECKYCFSSANQETEDVTFVGGSCGKNRRKKWFFRNSNQVSMGLLLIEKHLIHCRLCPKNVISVIRTAKHQERNQRSHLRQKTGEKVTRKEYASLVYKRLGFGAQEMN